MGILLGIIIGLIVYWTCLLEMMGVRQHCMRARESLAAETAQHTADGDEPAGVVEDDESSAAPQVRSGPCADTDKKGK